MKPEKEKSEKKIRAKLTYILIAMVVGVVLLGGAAFAWYTLSTDPEITGIKISVNTDQALLVSLDNKEYTLSTQLKDLSQYAPLVPVSTVDGLNWFICRYDATGNVLQEADDGKGTYDGTQFMYLRFPDGGNVRPGDGIVKKELGNMSETEASYYIYTDIYLKTENAVTDVYLSLPSVQNYEAQDTEKDHYGSYVMSYSYDEETGTITALDKASNTAARVGIMVLGAVEDGEEESEVPAEAENIIHPEYFYVTSNGENTTGDDPETEEVEEKDSNRFLIYEPNADSRSYADKSDDYFNADLYVAGFRARTFRVGEGPEGRTYGELDGYYMQTYPIRATDLTQAAIRKLLLTGKESNTIPEGKEKSEKEEKTEKLLQTMYGRNGDTEGTWKISGQDLTDTDGETVIGKVDGRPSYFDTRYLSIQKASTWADELPEGLEEGQDIRDFFNSTMIGDMGRFLKQKVPGGSGGIDLHYVEEPESGNDDYTAVDISSPEYEASRGYARLTRLTKDVPQKIRLYFWIEGQDVDCWNDISITDFLVNLEFVGDVIQEQVPKTAS